MNLPTYLVANYATDNAQRQQRQPAGASDDSLDDLIHQKSAILGRKLDILAAEIWWRLHISARNLAALADDKALLQDMLNRLDLAANYHRREHQEKGILYRKLFDLETEQRTERVECWRDVVMVMRDFLEVWEAHEQARARAMFIQNVGTGT
jgi:hypothetical protein